jgi:hypothetical protein
MEGLQNLSEVARRAERIYHRDKEARLVKLNDDVLSASRTRHMMLRHAQTKTIVAPRRKMSAGHRNW